MYSKILRYSEVIADIMSKICIIYVYISSKPNISYTKKVLVLRLASKRFCIGYIQSSYKNNIIFEKLRTWQVEKRYYTFSESTYNLRK